MVMMVMMVMVIYDLIGVYDDIRCRRNTQEQMTDLDDNPSPKRDGELFKIIAVNPLEVDFDCKDGVSCHYQIRRELITVGEPFCCTLVTLLFLRMWYSKLEFPTGHLVNSLLGSL